MGYPDVNIVNSTKYPAYGVVSYASSFCSNDHYEIAPDKDWTHSRGICLILEIWAVVKTPKGDIRARSYESTGTSFSQFAIIQVSELEFQVTRRVTGAEDMPPVDYAEPTVTQK